MRSDISGFHKLSITDRINKIKEIVGLTDDEIKTLCGPLDLENANRMIENVIGVFSFPLGIATNFLINGKDYLIPMALDESSVVAAASNAAKLARSSGGFLAEADEPVMIGQIQLLDVNKDAVNIILQKEQEICRILNDSNSTIIKMGGGFKGLETWWAEDMLIVNLLIDVRDAMGANFINTMSEKIAPYLEEWTGGRALLRIVSNLCTKRIARARAVWTKDALEASFEEYVDGDEIINGIIDALRFAKTDLWRCATHNKGIMNGVDAVMIATGNDWRAVEAGAHTYSRLNNRPLTRYHLTENGIMGEIEIPIACGIVGGITNINRTAQICLKILGVKNSQELAQVAACVGLANNFAALRALVTEGIQKGHMKLHATNIAYMAGARGDLIDKIVEQMIMEKNISFSRAKELYKCLEGCSE